MGSIYEDFLGKIKDKNSNINFYYYVTYFKYTKRIGHEKK